MPNVKHPAVVQIRGKYDKLVNIVKKLKNVEIVEEKFGVDVYFEDVNYAKEFISKVKKIYRAKVKHGTKYAGLRKGRVRWFFSFSLRIKDES